MRTRSLERKAFAFRSRDAKLADSLRYSGGEAA